MQKERERDGAQGLSGSVTLTSRAVHTKHPNTRRSFVTVLLTTNMSISANKPRLDLIWYWCGVGSRERRRLSERHGVSPTYFGLFCPIVRIFVLNLFIRLLLNINRLFISSQTLYISFSSIYLLSLNLITYSLYV